MMSDLPEPRVSVCTLQDVLRAAAPRPGDGGNPATKEDKITYAARFADNMARCIANGLRDAFPGVLPDEGGSGTESPAGAVRGPKKLDVNYSTPQLGLGLGVSLKSVHFRDVKGSRKYTHNRKRNDEELRTEASGYHQRQPFAVMIGVVFLPYDSCNDGRGKNASSFGSWVKYLRPLSGRDEPSGDIARFEAVFVGLYDPAGASMEFFNVETAPPRHGQPTRLLSYQEFLEQVEKAYLRRNAAEFKWADEELPEGEEPESNL
jgi:hypothetical protein